MPLMDPDVEAGLIQLLDENIADAVVGTQRPNADEIPAKFIKINSAGGSGRREVVLVDHLVTVECWGLNSVQASLLARQAHAYIYAAEGTKVGGVVFYSVTANSPVNFPDLETRHARYVFTVSLLTRATQS